MYEDAQNTEVKNKVEEATVFPAIKVIKGQAQPTRDCVPQQASPRAVWTTRTKLSSAVLVTVVTDPSQVLQLNRTCGDSGHRLGPQLAPRDKLPGFKLGSWGMASYPNPKVVSTEGINIS